MINLFPFHVSQNTIKEATHEQMLSVANFVASSLESMTEFSADNISAALAPLEFDPESRVLVCDSSARVLFDSA